MYQYAFFWNGSKIIITLDTSDELVNATDMEAKRFLQAYLCDFEGRPVHWDELPEPHSMIEVKNRTIWHINLDD